MTATGNNKRE